MIPDGNKYAEQFVSLNSHFRRRLMRTKNLWICQTVSRWLLGSITISSSSNLRQLQHWKLWCQPFGRPRLQYLNHLREARHLWQDFDRHLSPDEILYLKWHLWLQSTWMEYERFQDIGNHQKTRWESKLNPFASRRSSGHLMGLIPNLPVIHGNVSIHRIKSNERKLQNAYSCSPVYGLYQNNINTCCADIFCSTVIIFNIQDGSPCCRAGLAY